MKLIDAIINVERPEADSAWHFSANIEEICESLHLTYFYGNEETNKRIKVYPIFMWICTDTHVGLEAIYVDGVAMGCTYKSARKNDARIEWISDWHADCVRSVIFECMKISNDTLNFNLMDPNQDIGDDFSVNFAGQALTDDGFYQGEPVRALIWYDWLGRSTPNEYRRLDRSFQLAVDRNDPRKEHVRVRRENGEQLDIPVKEFRMKFNLKD